MTYNLLCVTIVAATLAVPVWAGCRTVGRYGHRIMEALRG